ncbi:hypothetical protein LTR36_003806 [Oleoguttula mirabilis]|uniref:Uncharacterized protein n=1 Tax=Oleoguttula mirabilis TaxID=1507867 RepID=A0AAV9JIV0_9PEZI|nr:hypothetical protein LTR36_003806 [Oleoguttula mirabilis]
MDGTHYPQQDGPQAPHAYGYVTMTTHQDEAQPPLDQQRSASHGEPLGPSVDPHDTFLHADTNTFNHQNGYGSSPPSALWLGSGNRGAAMHNAAQLQDHAHYQLGGSGYVGNQHPSSSLPGRPDLGTSSIGYAGSYGHGQHYAQSYAHVHDHSACDGTNHSAYDGTNMYVPPATGYHANAIRSRRDYRQPAQLGGQLQHDPQFATPADSLFLAPNITPDHQSLLQRLRISHGLSTGFRQASLSTAQVAHASGFGPHIQAPHDSTSTFQALARPVSAYPNGIKFQKPIVFPGGALVRGQSMNQQELSDFQRALQISPEKQDDDEEDMTSIADDDDFPLEFTINSVEEARQRAHARVPLKVKSDDWEVVKRSKLRQKQWVARIMAALRKPYKSRPEARRSGISYTIEELAEWTRWQEGHNDLVNGLLDDEELAELDEAAGWWVLGEVLDTHRLGRRLTG